MKCNETLLNRMDRYLNDNNAPKLIMEDFNEIRKFVRAAILETFFKDIKELGWICPKCERSYSSIDVVKECNHCNKEIDKECHYCNKEIDNEVF